MFKSLSFVASLLTIVIVFDDVPNVALAQEQPARRYWNTSFSLRDADVAKLNRRLSFIGIGLPFTITGNVTTELNIGVPLGAIRDAKAYRIDGAVSSPSLVVSGVRLDTVRMDLKYRDGVLDLQPIVFDLPDLPADPNAEPVANGQFRGAIRLGLVPTDEMTADLTLTTIPIRPITQQIPNFPVIDTGALDGQLSASVPLDKLSDLTAWDLNGNLTVSNLKAFDQTLRSVRVDVEADDGVLEVSKLDGTIDGATIGGNANLKLTAPFGYEADVKVLSENIAGIGKQNADDADFRGQLELTGHVEGTLSPSTVAANGRARLTDAEFANIPVPVAGFEYRLNDAAIELQNLTLQSLDGNLIGAVRLPRVGNAPATANLQTEKPFSLTSLLQVFDLADLPIRGGVDGTIAITAPQAQLTEPTKWQAAFDVFVREGEAFGLQIGPEPIQARLANERFVLKETSFKLGATSLAAGGEIATAKPFAYSAKLKLNATDLSDLNRLDESLQVPTAIQGSITTDLTAKGELAPFTIVGDGTIQSDQLAVAGARIDSLAAKLSTDGKTATLSELAIKLYEGSLTGTAKIPLRADNEQLPNVAKDHDFNLDVKDVDLGRLAADLASLEFDVAGRLSGRLTGQYVANPDKGLPVRFQSRWQIPQITVGGIGTGNINATAGLSDESLDYKVDGELFDGALELKGSFPLEETDEETSTTSTGRLRWNGVSIVNIASAFDVEPPNGRTRGNVSVEFDFRHSQTLTAIEGSGRVQIVGWIWGGQPVTDRLESRIAISKNVLRVSSNGELADGRLIADITWNFQNTRANRFSVDLLNANVETFLLWAPAEVRTLFTGRLDIQRVNIDPGDPWRAEAVLSLTKGSVADVTVSSLSIPFRATWTDSGEKAEINVRSFSGIVGGGHVRGNLLAHMDGGNRVVGAMDFENVNLSAINEIGKESGALSGSQVSGELTISGKRMRSLNDLVVTLDANFSRTRSSRLPLIASLLQAIPGVRVSQPIQEGHVYALLQGDVVTIDELAIRTPSLVIYATGTVTLRQRLNLELVVATGDFDRPRGGLLGLLLLRRIDGAGPSSAGLFARFGRLLTDQLISFNVRGTIARPVLKVRSIPLLPENGVQFFISGSRRRG